MGRRLLFCACAMLFLTVSSAAAQTRIITGTVLDATSNEPIASAEVMVVGTDITVRTREDGTFSIGTPQGSARLMVRVIGYRRSEIVVPVSQTDVDVFLEQDILRLEEIVVTGQATGVERRNLAQAISTISTDQIEQVPAQTIEQAFYGRVAGADVQANSGAPGGGMQIRLRGISSILGASTPLYVVDGVMVSDGTINDMLGTGLRYIDRTNSGREENSPNRIADLNPNDIQNIEILKGASAAAIYGSKANNGVILITTKRGRAGRPQFDLTQRFGVADMSNKLGLRVFNTLDEAIEVFGPCAAPAGAGRDPTADCKSDDGWQAGRVFDHEEEIAGANPLSYETSLGVSGGTEDTRYYVSALAKHDGGIVQNTGYDKQSLKVNIDQELGSGFQFQLSTNALHTFSRRGVTNNDNRSISYWMAFPQIPTFVDIRQNEDGSWPVSPYANSNPLQTAELMKNDEHIYRFIGGANLSWDALMTGSHELRLNVLGGADYFSQKNWVFAPPEAEFEPIDGLLGTSIQSAASSLNYNLNANAVHTFLPSGNWTATTSVGVQYEVRDIDQLQSLAQDLVGGLANIGAGTVSSLAQSRFRTQEVGIFAQEEVLVAERLLLTAGMRMDRSSNNADTEEWYFYPKAAASYRIPVGEGLLNEFKFRAAYGESGNQPKYGRKFNNYNPANISGIQTLRLSTTVAAPDIRPERQKEIEAGVDAALFNNLASLEATVYQKRIADLLVRQALPPSTGASTNNFNGGVMRTRGLEAALMVIPVSSADMQWISRTTFSMDRSLITELPVAPFSPGGFGGLGSWLIREGKSPTMMVGNDTAVVDNDPLCLDTTTPTVDCQAGDRIRNVDIGDSRPRFIMGFSNDFKYKSLTLSSVWHWQQGGLVSNLTRFLFDLSQTAVDYADDCAASGYPGCDPAGETVGEMRMRTFLSKQTATQIEDATFLKLRELTLSLDLPRSMVESIWEGARHVRLQLSARDLLRFTGYTGMDPEVANFGTSYAIARGQDVAPYPPSRSIWFAINVGF